MSILSKFTQSAQSATLQDAQEQFAEETKSLKKSGIFQMKKDGKYVIQVLPTKPDANGVAERDWEFPVHTKMIGIQIPNSKKLYYIEIIRPSYAGIEGALLPVFDKLAKAELNQRGDKETLEKMGHWMNSLTYNYTHPCYIVNLNESEDKQEIEILPMTHGQFKSLQKSRFDVWEGEKRKAERDANRQADKEKLVGEEREAFIKEAVNSVYCPMTNPLESFPVVINRETGDRTEYTCKVDSYGDILELTEDLATKLFDLPTIKEVYYQYNRYQFEATVIFLAQKDAEYGTNVLNNPEFIEVKNKIESQLPSDDVNGFKAKDEDKNEYTFSDLVGNITSNAILLDDILNKADKLADGIESGAIEPMGEEEAGLRGTIDAFIKQEGLNITITVDKTNDDLIDEIEAFYSNPHPVATVEQKVEVKEEPVDAPVRRRRR